MDVETNPSRRLKQQEERRNLFKMARTTSSCPNRTLLTLRRPGGLRNFHRHSFWVKWQLAAWARELKHYIIRHQGKQARCVNVHVTSSSTVRTDAKGTTHSVRVFQQAETASLLFLSKQGNFCESATHNHDSACS